ncbi:MAG: BatA domain-containing protein, partial [Boseongicola sp.]
MWSVGPIGFTAPWLLLGLILLPVLWLLLRAVPPAPIRRRFPGVALLLGLKDDESQTDRTPWWLLLLRMLAISAAIIGFAGPVLNPEADQDNGGRLLILVDGTWADAPDWGRRMERIEAALNDVARAGREATVVVTTDLPPDSVLNFRTGDSWIAELAGLEPRAWSPSANDIEDWSEKLDGRFDTFWLSDGLDWDWRAPLLSELQSHGAGSVFEASRNVFVLKPARFQDGVISIESLRSRALGAADVTVVAHGLDPSGTPRQLATASFSFASGEQSSVVQLSLPPELRNRVTRFEIAGQRSAGAVALTDDALRRREVAIVAARDEREGLRLLSPTHYLEQALLPNAEMISGAIPDLVLANPDVVVLADIAALAENETDALESWVRDGGILLRFAGPRLAASDVGREEEDILMPVRLRAGGRNIGGAMSWGEPKTVRAFSPESPFFGLPVPPDVTVNAQVMA